MKIGIIGVGIIGTAVATGFCEAGRKDISLVLSPRGRARGLALKEKYPDRIEIAESNQEVVDASDWIILAVLPEHVVSILTELKFRPDQKMINLVSTLGMEEAKAIVGDLSVIVDVVPLPFNARRIGPVILYPPVEEARELLSLIGDVVSVETPVQMATLRTVTALMSPYYQLVATIVDWCKEKGMEEEAARKYTTSFFGALSVVASGWEDGLENLANEMTPGGLNWQALTHLKGQENFKEWTEILDPIMARVTKK